MGRIECGYRGPDIVGNGLVLYLDANSRSSYSSFTRGDVTDFGTTWRDISGNSNNGTLTNGPVFSSFDGGSFTFDGTNDYASTNFTVSTVSFTIQVWLRTTVTGPAAGGNGYEGRGIVWADQGGVGNDFILAHNGTKASFFTGNPDSTIHSTTNINTGAWILVTAIKNGTASTKQLYINTTADTSGTSNANVLNARSAVIAGNTLDNLYFSGSIATVNIYNRVLSATEITQNYNAVKSRFGL